MKYLSFFIILFLLFSCDFPPNSIHYPANFSWMSVDLNNDGIAENYVTSIKNQKCNDCSVYSAIGMLEIQYQIDHKSPINLNLSEQNIHNCMNTDCKDIGDTRDTWDFIKQCGVLEEQYSPVGQWQSCENCQEKMKNIPFYSFKDYQLIAYEQPYETKKELIIKALQEGPIVITLKWGGWKIDGNYMYCEKITPMWHFVIIVGYEDYGNVFLAKNSHGEGKLLKMVFDGGETCLFAADAWQIMPGSTYIFKGMGKTVCMKENL